MQTHTIPLSDISIPEDRIRREFDKKPIIELALDIHDKGLLNPITLRNDRKTLVAGERRLLAVTHLFEERKVKAIKHNGQLLPEGHIAFSCIGDLSPDKVREAELTENVCRRDLTWQERIKAMDELHQLRVSQNPAHRKTDTAAEISGKEPQHVGAHEIENVSRAGIISRHLNDPDIAKAKDERAAFKLVSKKYEQEFMAELARRNVDTGEHTLIHGDLHEEIRKLPANSFDLIIADPPYGVDADTRFGDMANLDHEYADSWEVAEKIYISIASEGQIVAKEKAHAYIFCDPFYFSRVWEIFNAYNWWVFKAPIVWYKGATGLLPYPDHGPRRTTEYILYAVKGKRMVNAVYGDLISVQNVKEKIHAAQKPVDLYIDLMRRSVRPGDRVLDPCCGCGTVFPAATKMSCVATGIEASEKSHNLALSRLGGE